MGKTKGTLIQGIIQHTGASAEKYIDKLSDKSNVYLEKLLIVIKQLPKGAVQA